MRQWKISPERCAHVFESCICDHNQEDHMASKADPWWLCKGLLTIGLLAEHPWKIRRMHGLWKWPDINKEILDFAEMKAVKHMLQAWHAQECFCTSRASLCTTCTRKKQTYTKTNCLAHTLLVLFLLSFHSTRLWSRKERFFFSPAHTDAQICRNVHNLSLFSPLLNSTQTHTYRHPFSRTHEHIHPHLIKDLAQGTSFSQFVQLSGSGW